MTRALGYLVQIRLDRLFPGIGGGVDVLGHVAERGNVESSGPGVTAPVALSRVLGLGGASRSEIGARF